MVSVTPFSFIDYFLTKINGHKPSRTLISRSFQLILSSIRGALSLVKSKTSLSMKYSRFHNALEMILGTEFLNFKPSEIAAAIAIYVSSGGTLAVDYASTISCFIQHDKLLKCLEMIQEMQLECVFLQNESSSLSSVTQSPNGVLDGACCFNY
ncbi:cyclin-D3-1-like [Papaver somniferum]|uniref:cyclin-D3-1-like n=1 Tax=Papaver somniferum TaxID=3469 RepID=UPI000E6F8B04|nr:cyclin-D3-1-like [Papaver somniferum]